MTPDSEIDKEKKIQCTSCKRNINPDTAWECENCKGLHHPGCSGDSSEGWGEYPSENAYSVCKNCIRKAEANA